MKLEQYRLNLLLVLLLLFSFCKKPEISKPSPCVFFCDSPSKLEVIWRKPLAEDSSDNSGSFYPLLDNEKIIFSNQKDVDEIICLNKINGEAIWRWDDYLYRNSLLGSRRSHEIKESNLYILLNSMLYGIDIHSGRTQWKNGPGFISEGYTNVRMSIINKYIYFESHNDNYKSYLTRCELNSGKMDTLLSIDSSNNFSSGIEPPLLWMNSMNDSILIFQNRKLHQINNQYSFDIIAFNLSKKKQEFILKDVGQPIELNGLGSVIEPLISDNKLYFPGGKTLYCINLLSQKTEWQYFFSNNLDNLTTGDLLIEGDKLFVKSIGPSLFCFNKNNGQVIWSNLEAGYALSGKMELYNNHIYYIGDLKLIAINALNGKRVLYEDSPTRITEFNRFVPGSGLVIDKSTGQIYIADCKYAYCLKNPVK